MKGWETRVEKKVRLKERRYEIDQLMKEKRSEEMEALEEVFDKSTLMIIYHMLNTGELKKIHGVVKAGKEARIYWGIGPRGKEVAVKIYLTSSTEFRKGRLVYIEGDPRFSRAKRDTRALVYLWAQKEFKNLEAAREGGVKVPKPLAVNRNVLLMEFIGRNGIPAPLLREAELKNSLRVYRKLLRCLRLLYARSKLVHGDLSEYNIMIWRDQPVLFDLSQAVPLDHPLANILLKRDIENLNNYFGSIGVEVEPVDKLFSWVVGQGGN